MCYGLFEAVGKAYIMEKKDIIYCAFRNDENVLRRKEKYRK